MPWRPDFFLPINENDPRNADRLDPKGERIRVRMNRDSGVLVDFVVQYETPIRGWEHSHAVVVRSDMTHAPHLDRYDRYGRRLQEWLPSHLSPSATVVWVVRTIREDWQTMRRAYYQGLR